MAPTKRNLGKAPDHLASLKKLEIMLFLVELGM